MSVFASLFAFGIIAVMVAWFANTMRKARIYECPDCGYRNILSAETYKMCDGRPSCIPCGSPMVFDKTWLQAGIDRVTQFVEDTRETIAHVRNPEDSETLYVEGEIDEEELEERVEEREKEKELEMEVED